MKKRKIIIIAVILFVLLVFILYFFIGFDTKKVVPKSKCSPETEEIINIGSVEGIDLYSYCIEDVKFLNNDGDYTSRNSFLKGTGYVTMIWDGGSLIYKGKNYYIIDCKQLNGEHLKYIISNIDNQQDAWSHCRD